MIATLKFDFTEVVQRMRKAPLILHRPKDVNRAFEIVASTVAVAECSVNPPDVVQMDRDMPLVIGVDLQRGLQRVEGLLVFAKLEIRGSDVVQRDAFAIAIADLAL